MLFIGVSIGIVIGFAVYHYFFMDKFSGCGVYGSTSQNLGGGSRADADENGFLFDRHGRDRDLGLLRY